MISKGVTPSEIPEDTRRKFDQWYFQQVVEHQRAQQQHQQEQHHKRLLQQQQQLFGLHQPPTSASSPPPQPSMHRRPGASSPLTSLIPANCSSLLNESGTGQATAIANS